jgi:hypothetical protein
VTFVKVAPHTETQITQMRTKTLLLTAALGGAMTTAAMAQAVYSQNIVGYVNLTVPTGYSMIANPLDGVDAALPTIFPAPPEETTIFKFTGAGYISASFIDGVWEGSPITLAPGEGAFILNPAAPFVNTFVGEVVLNSNNQIPAGYSIRASSVPQAGGLSSVLEFPAAEEDTIFQFTGLGYVSSSFIDGAWEPSEPDIKIGESFFVLKQASANWTRNFSVN